MRDDLNEREDAVTDLGAATELTLGNAGGPFESFVIPELQD